MLRVLFGLLGMTLGFVGMYQMLLRQAGGLPVRLAAAWLFFSIAVFCWVSVLVRGKGAWPIVLVGLSLAMLFAVRIVFGA